LNLYGMEFPTPGVSPAYPTIVPPPACSLTDASRNRPKRELLGNSTTLALSTHQRAPARDLPIRRGGFEWQPSGPRPAVKNTGQSPFELVEFDLK
jgi:hypothetical protein